MRKIIVALIVVCASKTAAAQLALRNSEVVEGAYTTIGNLLIDCPTTAVCDNNTAVMAPVDVDADASTSMSSSATLDMPSGAVVRRAFLYISGSGTETTAGTNPSAWIPPDLSSYSAFFAGPGQPYSALVPLDVAGNTTGNAYLARYDVTSLIFGTGEYFVADALMPPATHPYNRILSWALFVTYADGSAPSLVNLYDGMLGCFMNTTTLNFAGFRTPAAVAPTALFTAWSVDGHPALVGESITVGTTMLSNAQNPANNIGNATVTSPTGPIPRNPSTFAVTEEMDLDTFDVSNAFTTSQTSTDISFTCGSLEGVVYQFAVIGVQIIAPQIVVEKTVVDLNGDPLVAGDELSYELRVATTGGDDAVDVVLRDPLPAGLAYVAGSIEYVTSTATKSDQAGDDEAEWTGSELIFRLGSGADATAGGTIAVGLDQIVRFHARVETTTVARSIVNQAFLTARGAQGGSGATLVEVASSSVAVDALPCVGFENGMCPDAGVIEEDASVGDAAAEDAALEDAAAEDAVGEDAALEDAVGEDAALEDAAAPDASEADAGVADAGGASARDAGGAGDAGAASGGDDAESSDGCGCSATARGRSTLIDVAIFFAVLAFLRRFAARPRA